MALAVSLKAAGSKGMAGRKTGVTAFYPDMNVRSSSAQEVSFPSPTPFPEAGNQLFSLH